MPEIKLSPSFMALLQRKGWQTKNLVLLADDGGGKYSLYGGACSIGENFTIVSLAQPDPLYQVPLSNDQGLAFWTSDYDLTFCEPGLALDYRNGSIQLKDRSRFIDGAVQLADGATVLQAAQHGATTPNLGC